MSVLFISAANVDSIYIYIAYSISPTTYIKWKSWTNEWISLQINTLQHSSCRLTEKLQLQKRVNWDEFSGWFIVFTVQFTDRNIMASLYILNFTQSKVRCFVFCFLFNNKNSFHRFISFVLFYFVYIFILFSSEYIYLQRPRSPNEIYTILYSNRKIRNLKLTSFLSTPFWSRWSWENTTVCECSIFGQ